MRKEKKNIFFKKIFLKTKYKNLLKTASCGIRTHALIRGLELESNALTNSAKDAKLLIF